MKTVFVLRHADYSTPQPNPVTNTTPLGAAGHERAQALARLLARAGVKAIFVTDAIRTQQTAQPLADLLDLPVRKEFKQGGPQPLDKIFDPASGPVVVVVGHGPTVPEIVAGLGVVGPAVPIDGHADLYVVTVTADGPPPEASAVRLTYGAAPAPAPTALAVAATGVTVLGQLAFTGDLAKATNLSAIDVIGDGTLAVVGNDEGNEVRVLRRNGDQFHPVRPVTLNPAKEGSDEAEIDIEGIAHDDATGFVYVVGSHSLKRKKVEANKKKFAVRDLSENRDDLKKITPEEGKPRPRETLYRFAIDATGKVTPDRLPYDVTTLRPFMQKHKLLEPFLTIPGKENGIDIEGLAFHAGLLYVGFRGPVLREGWAIVLRCQFKMPEVRKDDGKLLFVNLDGYGVRDLARGKNEFLILAGPAGEARSTFRLYSWDGEDCLPGVRADGSAAGRTVLLGDVPDATDPTTGQVGKPEGITLLNEDDPTAYELLVVYDNIPGGRPTRLRVPKG